ncbi:MAG: hypothetical protein ACM3S2_11410 [Ignavibacteriales bacterium]
MKEKYKYIVAFILLMGFAFNFAHSEFDFMTPEGDTTHYAHDFCQLTNAPAFNASVSAGSFIHYNPQPFSAMACILPETILASGLQLKNIANISPGNSKATGTPLFVINRTLLI